MEAAAKNSEKKIRAAGKIWRDDETRKLLELMRGGEEGLGFYGRMKVKKLERNRAMSAIAANLSADNIAVTSQQVNNKRARHAAAHNTTRVVMQMQSAHTCHPGSCMLRWYYTTP